MLHLERGTLSNNEAAKTRVKDIIEKRAQAVDAINRTMQAG
jgi:hypothetical protein